MDINLRIEKEKSLSTYFSYARICLLRIQERL